MGILNHIGKLTKRKSFSRPKQNYTKQKQVSSIPKGNVKQNYYLYVLKLSNGGMYVGITNNPSRRWLEHSGGKGAKITHLYPPVGVLSCNLLGYMTYAQAEKYEDDMTLSLMEQYGYSCVRGGHWSMVNDKAIYSALVNNHKRIARDFNRNVSVMIR